MSWQVRVGRLALLWALAAAALVGCGDDPAGPGLRTTESDLVGRVLAGPTCPVETAGSPCPPAPVDDALVELVRGSEVVASTRTDAEGGFRLSAAAGSYVARARSSSGLPSESTTPVTLRAGAQTSVTLMLDTGIR